MQNKSLARIVLCISLLISILVSGVTFAADEPDDGWEDPGNTGNNGGNTSSSVTVTDTTSTNASVEVSFSCSFTRDSSSSDSYSTDLLNGNSAEISGSTFTTFCNDSNGYSIYAIGYSNNEFGNTDLIFNNTPDSTNNITTDGTNSNWRMKATGITTNNLTPSIVNNFNNYHIIPSTYTKIATLNSATDTSNSNPAGSSIAVSYQATASSSQPAGTYTGQVKYTMVHPASAIMSINDLTFMQDFATLSTAEKASVLTSMIEGKQYQLKDNRDPINNGTDYKTYYVAKLADGKVWMTQNLDHDIRTDTDFYTHANTDLGYGSTINPNAKWTAPSNVGAWGSNEALVDPRYYDPGDKCWDETVTDVSLINCTQANSHYHVGNYYNWTAAVALSNSSNYTTKMSLNQSICPAGWTLPMTTDFTDLITSYGWPSGIFQLGNNKKIWEEPLYFGIAGHYEPWRGTYMLDGGFYVSNTVNDSSTIYVLGISIAQNNVGAIFPPDQLALARRSGDSVRCVAR